MVADVQLWLNQPATNFGWLLRTENEVPNFSARRFASREDPNRAPVLTIEYSPPRIKDLAVSNGIVTLRFHAEPGWSNVVQYSAEMNPANWQSLTNIPPLAASAELAVSSPVATAQRYFRLWLP